MSSPAVVGAVVAVVLFWAVFVGMLVRRSRRGPTGVNGMTRPGWGALPALPSAEVAASVKARGSATPGPATLLYGSDGVELWFGTQEPTRFVALRWSKLAEVYECDMSALGTRRAKGVRFELVDGRTLELRLLPSRELRRHHRGETLQGVAVAELLAVRGGARPTIV